MYICVYVQRTASGKTFKVPVLTKPRMRCACAAHAHARAHAHAHTHAHAHMHMPIHTHTHTHMPMQVSVLAKLVVLAANKFAIMDPQGMGVEMEVGP